MERIGGETICLSHPKYKTSDSFFRVPCIVVIYWCACRKFKCCPPPLSWLGSWEQCWGLTSRITLTRPGWALVTLETFLSLDCLHWLTHSWPISPPPGGLYLRVGQSWTIIITDPLPTRRLNSKSGQSWAQELTVVNGFISLANAGPRPAPQLLLRI